jgi:arylsulfatase A-like enzyme
MDNVLVVLTGDHGVAPSAEELAARHMPGGRIGPTVVKDAIQAALAKTYGPGEWVAGSWDLSIYLNQDLIAKKALNAVAVRRLAAETALGLPHIFRAYTRDQLLTGAVPGDEISRRVMNGFNVRRSPDIAFMPEPYWVVTSSVSTHGTPFSYDAHVPVIFMGPGIRPGRYEAAATVNDIAPTLASIIDVETPSGSIGRVLSEMFLP